MKKLSTYFLAAAVLFAAGCDSNIPETGTINNARVEQVVLDEILTNGVALYEGETLSLPELISALPIDATNTAQIYMSSNESVATVSDEGVLTAIKEGKCVITVYIGEDGVSAEFTVNVSPVPAVVITSLQFSRDNAEYTFQISANLVNSLAIEPMDYTESLKFTSTDEDVATVTEDGQLNIVGIGETTIKVEVKGREPGNELTDEMTISVPSIEYARFPGDGDGSTYPGVAREIMGTSAEQWDAMPHSDGGWTLCDFGALDDAGAKVEYSWNASTGQRNCYRYGMLDNRRILDRGGAANNLPTASNGTALCWGRPGGNQNNKENKGIYFVIDMQKSQPVNYFRTVHISNNADDRGVAVTKVSHIYGSNEDPLTTTSWTEIATDITDFYTRTGSGTTEDPYIVPLESQKAYFSNTDSYRYIKFVFDKQDHCYGFYSTPDATTADRPGTTIQIAELYLGYDPDHNQAAE